MTSWKIIKIFDFNGVNVAKHWHVAGEVFAISDCLVDYCKYSKENNIVYMYYVPLIMMENQLTWTWSLVCGDSPKSL